MSSTSFWGIGLEKIFFFFLFLFSCYLCFLLLFRYSFLHFQPITAPRSIHPCLPTLNLPLLALPMCPLYRFLDGPSPIFLLYPSPSSPLLLSVCSLCKCLWLYFACLFILLIRFHLKMRSYGICPSPPGLFHLA